MMVGDAHGRLLSHLYGETTAIISRQDIGLWGGGGVSVRDARRRTDGQTDATI